MAMEAIKMVTETEKEMQRQKEEAVAAARQMVADAERAGRQLLEDGRRQAEAQARQQLTQAEEIAAERTRGVLDQAGRDCEQLRQTARGRMDRATECIMERIGKR